MEDVRIGRATISADKTIVVDTTPKLLLEAALDRYCVIISPPLAGQVTIGFDANHVASGSGIVLASGADPLVLTIQEHGDMVRRAIFAAVDAPPRNVGIMYSSLLPVENGKDENFTTGHVQQTGLRTVDTNEKGFERYAARIGQSGIVRG